MEIIDKEEEEDDDDNGVSASPSEGQSEAFFMVLLDGRTATLCKFMELSSRSFPIALQLSIVDCHLCTAMRIEWVVDLRKERRRRSGRRRIQTTNIGG